MEGKGLSTNGATLWAGGGPSAGQHPAPLAFPRPPIRVMLPSALCCRAATSTPASGTISTATSGSRAGGRWAQGPSPGWRGECRWRMSWADGQGGIYEPGLYSFGGSCAPGLLACCLAGKSPACPPFLSPGPTSLLKCPVLPLCEGTIASRAAGLSRAVAAPRA